MNNKYGKICLLFFLYFSQGLPFGFQATALPVYLRMQNISLAAIGLAGVLAAPWMFKALWAPLIDRYFSRKIGRRKSWIIPLQLLLIITIILTSAIAPETSLLLLLTGVFFMNLFAATQDIAVDGLTIDILRTEDLGPGNAAQVVGYKTGMLISGGLLVWLSSFLGWNNLFIIMAVLAAIPLIMIIFYRESDKIFEQVDFQNLKQILAKAVTAFRLPGAGWLILFIATYKIGEVMIDIMFKPFLVDSGFSASQIGLWVGTYGMAASLAGSLIGGYLSSKFTIHKALVIASCLRIIPLALEWWLTLVQPSGYNVIGITVVEHLFGGMLTTAMFAFMMSRVNKEIGATHYTILAAVEVLGKSPGGWASGILAEFLGYSVLFALGTLISLATLGILPKLKIIINNNVIDN